MRIVVYIIGRGASLVVGKEFIILHRLDRNASASTAWLVWWLDRKGFIISYTVLNKK